MDFTQANGKPDTQNSLHNIKYPGQNEYKTSMSRITNTLNKFYVEQEIACFGFGAKLPVPFQDIVSHCFAVNGNIFKPACAGVRALESAYDACIRNIELHGPTAFGEALSLIFEWIRSFKIDADHQEFFILTLITRGGHVVDFKKVREMILDNQDLPMTMFCFGVGTDKGSFEDLIRIEEALLPQKIFQRRAQEKEKQKLKQKERQKWQGQIRGNRNKIHPGNTSSLYSQTKVLRRMDTQFQKSFAKTKEQREKEKRKKEMAMMEKEQEFGKVIRRPARMLFNFINNNISGRNDMKLMEKLVGRYSKQLLLYFESQGLFPINSKLTHQKNLRYKIKLLQKMRLQRMNDPNQEDGVSMQRARQKMINQNLAHLYKFFQEKKETLVNQLALRGFSKYILNELVSRGLPILNYASLLAGINTLLPQSEDLRKLAKQKEEEQARQEVIRKQNQRYINLGQNLKLHRQRSPLLYDLPYIGPSQLPEDEAIDKLCRVCSSSQRDIAIMPCKHQVVCSECTDYLRRTCPKCGVQIERLVQLYNL